MILKRKTQQNKIQPQEVRENEGFKALYKLLDKAVYVYTCVISDLCEHTLIL